jgi:hypothetical protein
MGKEGVIDVESLLNLVTDYWPIVICAIVVIAAFQWIMRSLFRLFAMMAVIGVILVLVFHFSPEQVINMGRTAVQTTQDAVQKTVVPILEAELKDADISFHDDGSYEVKTASIRITGKKGDTKATVYYKENKWEVDIGVLGDMFKEKLNKAESSQNTL